MASVIIIGKGPAGISTALYTARAGIKTTIIGRDLGALSKANQVDNYWGFAESVDAKTLVESGNMQAERLGAEIITDEVVGIGFTDKLVVKTRLTSYSADAVVFATGATRGKPPVNNMEDWEGKGISYCAICDAFFYKQKDVCVIGNGEYAKSEAMELLPIVKSVTMLTNGLELETELPKDIIVDKRKIIAFKGDNVLKAVEFESGEDLSVSGAFIAIGTASSCDLARKIGAQIDKNRIVVDKNMMTNVPSLYAVGDCVGGLLQIAKAVSDGAIAGTSIVRALRK